MVNVAMNVCASDIATTAKVDTNKLNSESWEYEKNSDAELVSSNGNHV